MNDATLFHPAIVQTAISELTKSGKPIAQRLESHERAHLEDAVLLGTVINQIKDQGLDLHAALTHWNITERQARDYAMAARCTPHVLKDCRSIRDALDAAPREREHPCAVPRKADHQSEPVVAPTPNSRAQRVGQKPPTPFPKPAESSADAQRVSAGGMTSAEAPPLPDDVCGPDGQTYPMDERQPGDDTPESAEKLCKEIAAIGKRQEEATKRLANVRQIESREVGSAIVLARAWTAWGTAKARGEEVVEPPREEPCGKCGAKVLLVTTTKNNKMYLDLEQGGPCAAFALYGGRAVFVMEAYKDRAFLYTAHAKFTCSKGIQ